MNPWYFLLTLMATVGGPANTVLAWAIKDTTAPKYLLQYDLSQLRIPGRSLPIGIVTIAAGGPASQTRGFLKGNNGWSKYKIEVVGGSYANGKIKIGGPDDYKKGDSLMVQVYTRRWFLGGKDKWLLTQKIPYDYEDSINILTTGNSSRAPGGHVQFGIRTWFDNRMFVDKWSPAKKNLKDFVFQFEGGHLSKSKDDLKIDTDLVKINNERVKLIAFLAKDSAIRDTLQIMLDYVANYECKVQSTGKGHDLKVAADVYFDSLINARLLKVSVQDSVARRTYQYLVNTNKGSITISSKGASGLDGRSGRDGSAGLAGSPETISVNVQTVVGTDGTSQTTTTTVQGPGGDGGKGGDGENGEDGGNGSSGGNILINYTPGAAPFLAMIKGISIPGTGGTGGRAGQGGRGGLGGSGNPSGNNGLSGLDGRAGFDGTRGSEGKVLFVQSPVNN